MLFLYFFDQSEAALETPSIVNKFGWRTNALGPMNASLHRVVDWTKNPHFEKVFMRMVKSINSYRKPTTKREKYEASYIYS